MITLRFVLGEPFSGAVELGEMRYPSEPARGQLVWLESRRWADDARVQGRRWFRVVEVACGGTDNGSRQADHFLYAPATVWLREVQPESGS